MKASALAGRKPLLISAEGSIMSDFNLSPLSVFLQAGPVGKAVMCVLLAASIWCWLLIAEALFGLVRLGRALKASKAGAPAPLLAAFEADGLLEAHIRVQGESVSERRQRIAEKMTRSGLDLLMNAEGGLSNLAVISSVSPFVGLFGTVWGIMASFVGIAAAKDTSLAVVAPGIAEALAATAYGLAAAIPASIGYNRLGAEFSRLGQQMLHLAADRAAELTRDEPKSRKSEAA
jgi:biopolymer transport protein ExbB/TolQ